MKKLNPFAIIARARRTDAAPLLHFGGQAGIPGGMQGLDASSLVQRVMRADAAENIFFLRQLELIEAQTHQVAYPDLKATLLIPTRDNYAPGAVKVTYRQYDRVGQAGIVSDRSSKLPRVDVKGTEVAVNVLPLGVSFGYSIYEIAAAMMAGGQPLEQLRANTAREAVARKLEDVAASGDTDSGLEGLLVNSAVDAGTAANGLSGSPLWANKSPLEILADLNLGAQTIVDATNGIESPDSLILPHDSYTLASQTPIGTDANKTILEFFLSKGGAVKNVTPWHYAKTAGSGTTRRMMFYRRDPEKVELRNPHGYQQLPPQAEGLEFVVPCHMTTAGVTFYKPKSAYYLDGI